MPEIIWRGTNGHNFTPSREGQRPIAIVNHVMMESIETTRALFSNPRRRASTTFGIGLDGQIDQYVGLEDSAWGNGPVRNPNTDAVPWIAGLCLASGINPNRLTISIEWEGCHQGGEWVDVEWQGETFPVWHPGADGVWWQPSSEQYEAAVWLHRRLISDLGIRVDRAHICRHADFDSVSKPFCPGEGFPLERLIADLQTPLLAPTLL